MDGRGGHIGEKSSRAQAERNGRGGDAALIVDQGLDLAQLASPLHVDMQMHECYRAW